MSRKRTKQQVDVYFRDKPIAEAGTDELRGFQLRLLNEVRQIHALAPLREMTPEAIATMEGRRLVTDT